MYKVSKFKREFMVIYIPQQLNIYSYLFPYNDMSRYGTLNLNKQILINHFKKMSHRTEFDYTCM